MRNLADDPLVGARHRFPMVSGVVDYSEELPSSMRPFVLRRAPVVVPRDVKHRTPSHQTKIPQKTTLDNRIEDDSYTVRDD